jgi:SAM-dependent methyltransferase
MNVIEWLKILLYSLKRNGPLQLFFYLSNLDIARFIEYSKTIEYLDREDRQIILDLGTGYSILPIFLKEEKVKGGSLYVTLDLSLNSCKFQADYKDGYRLQIRGDMTHLPIRSSSVSVVIAISSVEHVPDDGLVFQEIDRILKWGGVAIISLPYSYKGSKIVIVRRARPLLFLLYKFRKVWSTVLGKHLNYFIEQIATDSVMKCYTDNDIASILSKYRLSLERSYYYGKLRRFFRYIPKGWFVLKDLFIGLALLKIEDAFIKHNKNANGIIFKIRKEP